MNEKCNQLSQGTRFIRDTLHICTNPSPLVGLLITTNTGVDINIHDMTLADCELLKKVLEDRILELEKIRIGAYSHGK